MAVDEIMKAGITVAIALIVISVTLPIGLESWYDVNTTAFEWDGEDDTKTVLMVELFPFFAILVIVMILIGAVSNRL